MKIKLTSTVWCAVLGVEVIDPDGWNRKNLQSSWDEEITFGVFMDRYENSTVRDLQNKSGLPGNRWTTFQRAIQALQ